MNALKLALAAIIVLIGAQVSGWPMLDHLFYILVGLGLVAALLSTLSLRGLRLERRPAADRGQVGELFRERVRLENTSRLGKLWVEVDDRSTLPGHAASLVAALRGRGHEEWTVSTRLTRRGRYQLGPTRVRSSDPFGLFPVQRLIAPSTEVLVYPTVIPLPTVPLPAGDLPGDSQTHGRAVHVTPNVGGVRDYTPGDSLNRIAWHSTARLGRLMVKEFDLDHMADIWVVLDMHRAVHYAELDGDEEPWTSEPWRRATAEYCVVVAASLGVHFLQQKRSVGLIVAGQHHEVLPTDRGPRQITKLLEALSVVEPHGPLSLGELLTAEAVRFSRHSTLLIVTPTTDERWAPVLATLLQGGMRASTVLVDAGTFGGPESPLLLVGQLAAMRVPSLVLNCEDDIAERLRQGVASTGAQRYRARPGAG